MKQTKAELQREIDRLRDELGTAYRALSAYALAHDRGTSLPETTVIYHSLAVGAARRYGYDRSLDGARYFIGKDISVLHEALKLEARMSCEIPPKDGGAT